MVHSEGGEAHCKAGVDCLSVKRVVWGFGCQIASDADPRDGTGDACWIGRSAALAPFHCSPQAERLVHRMDRFGAAQGELGLALFKLSKAEEAEGLALAQFSGTVRQPHSWMLEPRDAPSSTLPHEHRPKHA